MKKNSIIGYATLGIAFLLVSVIVFVIPTEKTASFWIAYGFTVATFAAQVGIWKVTLGRDDPLKSKFFGFPVLHIGIIYLILQLLALAVFTAFPTMPTWSAVVVCSLILGISAIGMISAEVGREEIQKVEAKVQKKVFYIKSLQRDVEMLAEDEIDPTVKAELKQLAEKFHFSDPMSNEALADLEMCISNKVGEIKAAVDKMALIQEITLLLAERNGKAKIMK